jgi:hypothetical protein
MMPISQFMGRLARANRAPKSTGIIIIIIIITTDKEEDRQTQDTGVTCLIQFYDIQTFIQRSV